MNKILIKIKDLLNKLESKIGDKKMHILCSFVITFLFGLLGIITGIFMGCLAGLAKEVYDYIKQGSGFSKEDLMYDIVGIVIAVILLLII